MRAVLYLSSQLPKRSETFVYRELLALRASGLTVHAATLHAPERDLGDARLDALAAEAIPVYGAGWGRLVRRPSRELLVLWEPQGLGQTTRSQRNQRAGQRGACS